MTLHVYKNHVTEWFIAESKEEALALAKEYYLENYVYNSDDFDDYLTDSSLNFEEEPDDKIMSMFHDPYEQIETKETMTCREFAEKYGKGFLCSTEY